MMYVFPIPVYLDRWILSSSIQVRVQVQTLFEDEPDLFEELKNKFLRETSANSDGEARGLVSERLESDSS